MYFSWITCFRFRSGPTPFPTNRKSELLIKKFGFVSTYSSKNWKSELRTENFGFVTPPPPPKEDMLPWGHAEPQSWVLLRLLLIYFVGCPHLKTICCLLHHYDMQNRVSWRKNDNLHVFGKRQLLRTKNELVTEKRMREIKYALWNGNLLCRYIRRFLFSLARNLLKKHENSWISNKFSKLMLRWDTSFRPKQTRRGVFGHWFLLPDGLNPFERR